MINHSGGDELPPIQQAEPKQAELKAAELSQAKDARVKLIKKCIIGFFGFLLAAMIYQTIFSDSTSNEPVAPKSDTVSGIKTEKDSVVSQEQKEAVRIAENREITNAKEGGDSYIKKGVFDVEILPEIRNTISKPVISGAATQVDKTTAITTNPSVNNDPEALSETDVSDANNDGKKTASANRSRTGSGGGSNGNMSEVRAKRIDELIKKKRDSLSTTNTSDSDTGGTRFAVLDDADFNMTNGNTGALPVYPGQSPNTQQPQPVGTGRGLRVGDYFLAEVVNGQNSDSPSPVMLARVLQGPLKGAQLVFNPTVAYDQYVFESSIVNFKAEQAEIKAIVVTPDDNLTNGFRSDVDYHTLYKLGIVFFHGMAKGGAEYVKTLGGNVSVSGETVIESNEFNKRDLLLSSAGGVADTVSGQIEGMLNRPPTVVVNAKSIIGILMVENFNPPTCQMSHL